VNRGLASISFLLLASAATVAHAGEGKGFKSGVFDPPRAAPDFSLSGSNGAPVSITQYRGKVVALAFGFTYCPRICPVTLANLAQVYEKLGPAASDVQVIFVSVDPDRDTPARMKEFLSFFNPAFVGATGTARELEALRDAYGVTAKRAVSEIKKLGYEVHHSTSVYLIDRKGNIRLLAPFGKSTDDILHDIKILLSEG
jgi:protein SCO1